jgi:tetratricopeptide (TPR) repeat protein
MRRVLAAAALCLAVAACTTPQTDALRRDSGALPAAAAIRDAPFFAQRTKECGPAALAMVLVRSGVPTGPDALVDEVYNPGRGGSLAPAVLAAARRAGRIAYPVNELKTLFAEVDRGRPVMVLQNLGLEWLPRWHYAVVVGYDLTRDTIVLHSGKVPFHETSLETFERTWARGEHWALAILRPGEFPAGVDPLVYARAVAGVERAGQNEVAAEAYAAAAARWPDDPVMRLALGNARYKLGDLAAAADAYREAAHRHPDRAEAHNNLAHVLGELGRYDEAEAAAEQAVALGGRNVELYRETLRSIRDARRKESARSG